MTQKQLFGEAEIASKTTGQRPLKALLDAGLIQRIGAGTKGNLFRYFSARTV